MVFEYCKSSRKRKFCGRKCYWESKKGIYPEHTGTKRKPFYCLDCEKKFTHRARNTVRCQECAGKADKSHLKVTHINGRGENHWNWKGGVTPQNTLERRRFAREIQKQVFERDGYICILCGSGGNITVDHIQPWAEYIELRFNIDNCRTLCQSCHYEITFGKSMPPTVKAWGHNLLKAEI